MVQPHWNVFEWDDPDKKNGNVQHLRDHEIEPHEAEQCFLHEFVYARMIGGLMMSTCWMEELIEAEG
jgi:hypothetical protein